MTTTQQHQQHLTQLCQQLAPWHTRFDQIGSINSLNTAFAEKLARFATDEQQLNIAIMGQVKAGKSSFLNALLFNGQPVLPTAATPKTANLTRISYGDSPALEVEYYTPAEWQDLCRMAAQDGEHDAAKVARELVSMVKTANVNADAILALGTQRIEAASIDDLMGKLNQYAGNDGQYTALVKMTRLYLPIDELKGFDVIDTPGMNDPVRSRTDKTKQEMARSDVVFFLSRSGQFLDQSDMDLLANQLPQSGVKRMILVAGQYDSAILDDGFNRSSLTDTEANLNKRLKQRAIVEMGKLAEQRRQAGRYENADMLEQLTTPILSSTFAHGFATWPQDRWNSAMQHVHTELAEMAADEWNDYTYSPADWLRIGNFDTLRHAYQHARQAKQTLLQQQREGILPEAVQALADQKQALAAAIEQRMHTLKTQDMATLTQQQTLCEQKIKGLVGKLEQMIGQQRLHITEQQRDVLQNLKQSQQQYNQLKTRTGTETEQKPYEVSTSSWYNPFSWGSSETRYRTVSVNYQYLSASDAIEQLGQYASNCQSDIETHFNKLINPRQLKLDLRRTLVDELQRHQADFDPNQFRQTLDAALDRLQLPELKLGQTNHSQQLSMTFSGEMRAHNQIEQLKQQFQAALHGVFEQISIDFKHATAQLTAQVSDVQANLHSHLTDSVHNELNNIKADFNHQQQAIDQYNELLAITQRDRNDVINH